jgi:hypothetical protein
MIKESYFTYTRLGQWSGKVLENRRLNAGLTFNTKKYITVLAWAKNPQ